tara:strand:+ start:178 stop:492 length:315 start_codon:yes stop_codon:yes gene_type:complete
MPYDIGAAAMLVGHGDLIASFLDGDHLTTQFMDHDRMSSQPYDYYGEEHWVRDGGVDKLILATHRCVNVPLHGDLLNRIITNSFLLAAISQYPLSHAGIAHTVE